jgi:predicted acyl esterase
MNDSINVYDQQCSTEFSHGMRIDWDVPIEMDDGVLLRADIYRPNDDGNYPVILSYGPYAPKLGVSRPRDLGS